MRLPNTCTIMTFGVVLIKNFTNYALIREWQSIEDGNQFPMLAFRI